MHQTRFNLFIGVSLLACIIGSQVPFGSAHPLQGQYLGVAPSNGNEHLLLFKLPETISTHLLESQVNSASDQQNYNQMTMRDARLASLQDQYGLGQQKIDRQFESEPSAQESAVSLTIPVSTLRSLEQSNMQSANYVPANQEAHDMGQSQQSQIALELAIADYLAELDKKNQDTMNSEQHSDTYHDSGYQDLVEPYSGRQDLYSTLTNRDPLSRKQSSADQGGEFNQKNYTNQHYQQIDQQPRLMQPQQITPNVHHQSQFLSEVQGNSQPSLWRNSHMTSPQMPSNPANSSDFSSLLAKLSSSSPDLLVRLRTLLKRSASAQAAMSSAPGNLPEDQSAQKYSSPGVNSRPLDNNNNKQVRVELDANNELLIANNVAQNELKSLFHNYLGGQRMSNPMLTNTNDGGQNSLGAFLSSQNITSHEEIKIPLIVIAMPRILSLKKNQIGSNLTNNSKNSTSQQTNSSAYSLSSKQPSSLVHSANSTQNDINQANGTYLNQIRSSQTKLNKSETIDLNSSYWTGSQQQYSVTTSLPLHTMAPYAQQFAMPRLTPGPHVRQYYPMQQQQQKQLQQHQQLQQQQQSQQQQSDQHAYYLPNYVKQLMPQPIGNESRSFESPSVHLSRPTTYISRSLFQSNAVGHQNSSSESRGPTEQLGSLGNGTANSSSVHFQMIDAMAQEQQPRQHSNVIAIQKNDQPTSSARSALPLYIIRQPQDQTNVNLRPQMVYLGQNSQQSSGPINRSPDYSDHEQQASPNDFSKLSLASQGDYQHGKLMESQQSALASKLSILEQISKLRPLFQSNKSVNSQEMASTETGSMSQTAPRMSPSQLVSIFSGINERKTSSSQQDKAIEYADTKDQTLGSNKKKATKMVLMIV